MAKFLFDVFGQTSRVLGKLSRLMSGFARHWAPGDLQQRSVVSSTSYDMVAAPDEPYYAQQYWSLMLPHFSGIPKSAQVLDLGCSQGRFAIKLGKFFDQGRVIGCDLSAAAIDKAKNYAALGSVHNIDFRVVPIAECLGELTEESMDVILLTEVAFFYPDWKADMHRIVKALKPGGVLVLSLRSQYFDALCVVRGRAWEDIDCILEDREGALFASSTVFSWQTSEEIRTLLVETHDLELRELCGIGVCSGIPGDPHDNICSPSSLSEEERRRLMALELALGKSVPDGGRYILAVARKPRRQTAKELD